MNLTQDAGLVFLFPLPDDFFKPLASQVLTALAFRGKVALDDILSCDSGVVGPG